MSSGSQNWCNDLPHNVRTSLPDAAKRLRNGAINQREYQAQIDRIIREDLLPRGFALAIREAEQGSTRFVIRATATGEVCETIIYRPD